MNQEKLRNRVYDIVASVFNRPPGQVTSDSSAATLEGWDSVAHVNLVLALEQEFGVHFKPEEVEQMLDVRTIVRILEARNAGTAKAALS